MLFKTWLNIIRFIIELPFKYEYQVLPLPSDKSDSIFSLIAAPSEPYHYDFIICKR